MRAIDGAVAVAEPDLVEAVVVGHQRRVVAEPRRLDQLERPRPRATSTAPASPSVVCRRVPASIASTLRSRTSRCSSTDSSAKSSWNQPWRGQLVAVVDDRRGRFRERHERVARNEPRRRDPAGGQQRQDPRRSDPRPELPVGQLHRRVAAADRIGHRVMVECQGDGQARNGDVYRHPRIVAGCSTRPWALVSAPASSGRQAVHRRRSIRARAPAGRRFDPSAMRPAENRSMTDFRIARRSSDSTSGTW